MSKLYDNPINSSFFHVQMRVLVNFFDFFMMHHDHPTIIYTSLKNFRIRKNFIICRRKVNRVTRVLARTSTFYVGFHVFHFVPNYSIDFVRNEMKYFTQVTKKTFFYETKPFFVKYSINGKEQT